MEYHNVGCPEHCNMCDTFIFFFFLLWLLKSHLGNVLVDMKLIDLKDTLPVGFIPIQETVDTRKLWPLPAADTVKRYWILSDSGM